nr:MAG TPA: hypothetical protein [Crassvirales sp.]
MGVLLFLGGFLLGIGVSLLTIVYAVKNIFKL